MQTKVIQYLTEIPETANISQAILTNYIKAEYARIKTYSSEQLEAEMANIGVKLNKPLHSVIYFGDPHADAQTFENMFFRRFGLIIVKLQDLSLALSEEAEEWLKKTDLIKVQNNELKLSQQGIDIMEAVIRTGEIPDHLITYADSANKLMLRNFILTALMQFIRKRALSANQFDDLWENQPEHFKANANAWFRNEIYPSEKMRILQSSAEDFAAFLKPISRQARNLVLGKHGKLFVLGDIIDRGGEPDKLIDMMANEKYRKYIRYIWGNHDILWMGAAVGNPASVAEALRISFRYDKKGQVDYLDRIGFNYKPLQDFAVKVYGEKRPAMLTEAKQDINAVIEKALFVIQSKLKHQLIEADTNNIYGMQDRLFLKELAAAKTNSVCIDDKPYGLLDNDFPTLDAKQPYQLTADEQEVLDHLVREFRNNAAIKKMMDFLFNQGQMYDINNGNLLIHANVPSDGSRKLLAVKAFGDKKGKELFDYLNQHIKELGKKYLNNEEIAAAELHMFMYLWEGHDSPLNGRDKMATWERYLLDIPKDNDYKGTPGEEKSLHWEDDMQESAFRKTLFSDFGTPEEPVSSVIHGHTPKNPSNLANIILYDEHGKPVKINVDAGWIKGHPGHIYYETSTAAYLVVCKLPKEEFKKIDKHTLVEFKVAKRFDFPKQRKFSDNVKESRNDKMRYGLLKFEWERRQLAAENDNP